MRRFVVCLAGIAMLHALSCGDSQLQIRVLFPDQTQMAQTTKLDLMAVEPLAGVTCATIIGKRASQLGQPVLAQKTISLPMADSVTLSRLPMKSLLISALAYNLSDQIFLVGCAEVNAEPGDSVQVTVKLVPCAAGSCFPCASDNSCPAGLDCVDGICSCIPGGKCPGCCKNGICQVGTNPSACGANGEACVNCSATDPCSTFTCQAGQCIGAAKPDGGTCSGGRCYGGTCCKGCWDGKNCVTGSAKGACGTSGTVCKDCDEVYPCRSTSCSAGTCSQAGTLPNLSPCTVAGSAPGSGPGICKQGKCCAGCWSGSLCRLGNTDTLCGSGGSDCENCSAATNDCATSTCVLQQCVMKTNKPDGTSCDNFNGQCYGGNCCTGCWDSGSQLCRPGSDDDNCGTDGEDCDDCTQSVPSQTCDTEQTCSS